MRDEIKTPLSFFLRNRKEALNFRLLEVEMDSVKQSKHICVKNYSCFPGGKRGVEIMLPRQERQLWLTNKNGAERQAWAVISKYKIDFVKQHLFGYRIFDFWSEYYGLVIEIDGKTHCKKCDSIKDSYLLDKFGIIVKRSRNFDIKKLEGILNSINKLEPYLNRITKKQLNRYEAMIGLINACKKEKKGQKKENQKFDGGYKGGKKNSVSRKKNWLAEKRKKTREKWYEKLRVPSNSSGTNEFKNKAQVAGIGYQGGIYGQKQLLRPGSSHISSKNDIKTY